MPVSYSSSIGSGVTPPSEPDADVDRGCGARADPRDRLRRRGRSRPAPGRSSNEPSTRGRRRADLTARRPRGPAIRAPSTGRGSHAGSPGRSTGQTGPAWAIPLTTTVPAAAEAGAAGDDDGATVAEQPATTTRSEAGDRRAEVGPHDALTTARCGGFRRVGDSLRLRRGLWPERARLRLRRGSAPPDQRPPEGLESTRARTAEPEATTSRGLPIPDPGRRKIPRRSRRAVGRSGSGGGRRARRVQRVRPPRPRRRRPPRRDRSSSSAAWPSVSRPSSSGRDDRDADRAGRRREPGRDPIARARAGPRPPGRATDPRSR